MLTRLLGRLMRNLDAGAARRLRRLLRPIQRSFMNQELRRFRRGRTSWGAHIGQAPLLVLTTTGRRTGLPRSTPLVHAALDGDVIISGGAGGVPWDPDWVLNLRAGTTAWIQLEPGQRQRVEAVELTGDERAAIWDRLCARTPRARTYQSLRTRLVPVFRLATYPADRGYGPGGSTWNSD